MNTEKYRRDEGTFQKFDFDNGSRGIFREVNTWTDMEGKGGRECRSIFTVFKIILTSLINISTMKSGRQFAVYIPVCQSGMLKGTGKNVHHRPTDLYK